MLEILRSIVQEVNGAPDLREALDIIVRRVKQAVQSDVCSVYLTDFDKREYVLRATDGLRRQAVDKVRFPMGKGLIGLVASRAEPLNVADAHTHEHYLFLSETGEKRFHGFLGVPVIQNRKVLGVLVVRQEEPRRFEDAEETFLMTLASQLAGAITHAIASGELAAMEGGKRRQRRFMNGRSGSPGVGIGPAVVAYKPADLRLVPDRRVEDVKTEAKQFLSALSAARLEIDDLKLRIGDLLPEEELALFDAWSMMLNSDSLTRRVLELIKEKSWAQGALRKAIDEHCQVFEQMEDPYMRERAEDVRELGRRILGHLQKQASRPQSYPKKMVLVGEEVSAVQLAEVPANKLVGIVCASGSSSSHVAILARALGVPAIMGVRDLQVGRLEGRELIVDGFRGRVYLEPPQSVRDEYKKLAEEVRVLSEELEQERGTPSQTQDGTPIHLYINTGLIPDLSSLGTEESEGVGLYRTELPFMVRDRFPSEEIQLSNYRKVLKMFHPRPVILRTLDIGGDKPLPYFPIEESNPFLGWRGIRISLDHPEIFLTQVRAMLRAAVGQKNLRIMLPMISHVNEVVDAKALILQAVDELQKEGYRVVRPKIGVMIEVPAAIFQAATLAKMVDFVSLGTNDLTQYLLAVDRNNPRVADLFDDMHPALLNALMQVMRDASPHLTDISVCGEMAGNPLSAILLVGMGYTRLSMSAGSLLRVKYVLRRITTGFARHLLESALRCDDAQRVHDLMEGAMQEVGLLQMIQPSGQRLSSL